MNFNFTDEQEQLREMLQRFVRQDYSFEKRRELLESSAGFSREVWKQLAELGVLAMTIPEAHGGLGGTAVDTLVIMDALSRGLLLEPYLSTVVMGAGLIARAGTAEQCADVLPAVAAGERLLALAHFETGARFSRQHVALRARSSVDGWVLDGAKSMVLNGDSADQLLVTARTAGAVGDANGISLFLVDANAPGSVRRGYRNHDGTGAAEITFNGVGVGRDALLGTEGQGLALIDLALDLGIAALTAEAVGIMDALVKATSEYLKQRKQFGVPIGSFQVLQHRVVDMLMASEQARSMSYLAAYSVDHDDAPERTRKLAAAKTLVGQAARLVGQQAVQLHGGIAVCDEVIVAHWFKRLTLINTTFGDADHHLARYSDLLAA
jgi:alkylation response protein AidB-like acyl-CoA dehydrogenase